MITINNKYDSEFATLINYLKFNSFEYLLNNLKNKLKGLNETDYTIFVEYFSQFHFWGTLDPEKEDYTALELRIKTLQEHVDDFEWLYEKLEDYLSKRTLIAILANWIYLDFDYMAKVKSIFKDYWEPDIFPTNKDDVLVDLGAYTGDSIVSYVNFYGSNYKRIYAYEITPSTCEELVDTVSKYHDVIPRQKGVGSENSIMYIEDNKVSSSANRLNETGKVPVEIVKLDEDLIDVPTFIKMDIEGAEKDALLGAKHLITKYKPKLAVCVYHGYDDLWQIPRMISEMKPNYKFYLRHNGGNLIPTEFVLLCK